jgi:hypothetical protein
LDLNLSAAASKNARENPRRYFTPGARAGFDGGGHPVVLHCDLLILLTPLRMK